MFCSRNHFTTVPQAFTPVYTCGFRLFVVLFSIFYTFSQQITSFFYLKQARERSTFIFLDSLRSQGYFCPNFCKATLDLRSTRAPTKENTKKHEKLLFLRKNCFFFRPKAFHKVSLLVKGLCLRHAISPHLDQLETCSLDH